MRCVRQSRHEERYLAPLPNKVLVEGGKLNHFVERRIDFVDGEEHADSLGVKGFSSMPTMPPSKFY